MKITYNELTLLLKIYDFENSLSDKYNFYASSSKDIPLKTLFEQLSATHRNHSESIKTLIKEG